MKHIGLTFQGQYRLLGSMSLFNFEGLGSKKLKRETVVKDGGLAQLGERLPCTQEASGSIPLISTTKRAHSSGG